MAQAAGASEPSAAGGERASAVGVAQVAGAFEPSAVLPGEESGEVSGRAPRLGELSYATGEWEQWCHHVGYKELLQLLATWESVTLPTRTLPTGP